jgi:hypothetical protein
LAKLLNPWQWASGRGGLKDFGAADDELDEASGAAVGNGVVGQRGEDFGEGVFHFGKAHSRDEDTNVAPVLDEDGLIDEGIRRVFGVGVAGVEDGIRLEGIFVVAAEEFLAAGWVGAVATVRKDVKAFADHG